MSKYKLRCFCQSGNCFKVANYLNCAGLEWEPVFSDFFSGVQRDAGWRENHNETGEVPVLELPDGKQLQQSGAILMYLAEKTGKFALETEDERWNALRWLLFDNHKFTGFFMHVRFIHAFQKKDPAPELMTYLRGRFERSLAIIDKHFASSQFAMGDRPTIVDFSISGFMLYPENESGYTWATNAPNMNAWLGRMRALPGFREPYDTLPGERIMPVR